MLFEKLKPVLISQFRMLPNAAKIIEKLKIHLNKKELPSNLLELIRLYEEQYKKTAILLGKTNENSERKEVVDLQEELLKTLRMHVEIFTSLTEDLPLTIHNFNDLRFQEKNLEDLGKLLNVLNKKYDAKEVSGALTFLLLSELHIGSSINVSGIKDGYRNIFFIPFTILKEDFSSLEKKNCEEIDGALSGYLGQFSFSQEMQTKLKVLITTLGGQGFFGTIKAHVSTSSLYTLLGARDKYDLMTFGIEKKQLIVEFSSCDILLLDGKRIGDRYFKTKCIFDLKGEQISLKEYHFSHTIVSDSPTQKLNFEVDKEDWKGWLNSVEKIDISFLNRLKDRCSSLFRITLLDLVLEKFIEEKRSVEVVLVLLLGQELYELLKNQFKDPRLMLQHAFTVLLPLKSYIDPHLLHYLFLKSNKAMSEKLHLLSARKDIDDTIIYQNMLEEKLTSNQKLSDEEMLALCHKAYRYSTSIFLTKAIEDVFAKIIKDPARLLFHPDLVFYFFKKAKGEEWFKSLTAIDEIHLKEICFFDGNLPKQVLCRNLWFTVFEHAHLCRLNAKTIFQLLIESGEKIYNSDILNLLRKARYLFSWKNTQRVVDAQLLKDIKSCDPILREVLFEIVVENLINHKWSLVQGSKIDTFYSLCIAVYGHEKIFSGPLQQVFDKIRTCATNSNMSPDLVAGFFIESKEDDEWFDKIKSVKSTHLKEIFFDEQFPFPKKTMCRKLAERIFQNPHLCRLSNEEFFNLLSQSYPGFKSEAAVTAQQLRTDSYLGKWLETVNVIDDALVQQIQQCCPLLKGILFELIQEKVRIRKESCTVNLENIDAIYEEESCQSFITPEASYSLFTKKYGTFSSLKVISSEDFQKISKLPKNKIILEKLFDGIKKAPLTCQLTLAEFESLIKALGISPSQLIEEFTPWVESRNLDWDFFHQMSRCAPYLKLVILKAILIKSHDQTYREKCILECSFFVHFFKLLLGEEDFKLIASKSAEKIKKEIPALKVTSDEAKIHYKEIFIKNILFNWYELKDTEKSDELFIMLFHNVYLGNYFASLKVIDGETLRKIGSHQNQSIRPLASKLLAAVVEKPERCKLTEEEFSMLVKGVFGPNWVKEKEKVDLEFLNQLGLANSLPNKNIFAQLYEKALSTPKLCADPQTFYALFLKVHGENYFKNLKSLDIEIGMQLLNNNKTLMVLNDLLDEILLRPQILPKEDNFLFTLLLKMTALDKGAGYEKYEKALQRRSGFLKFFNSALPTLTENQITSIQEERPRPEKKLVVNQ